MSHTKHHITTRQMFGKLRAGLAKPWNFKRAFRKMWEYTEKQDELKAKSRAVDADSAQQIKEAK